MSVAQSSLLESRATNIAIRTAHIAAMGILLGGHAFNVPKADLVFSFWCCMGTGLALVASEAGPRLLWLHQRRDGALLKEIAPLCRRRCRRGLLYVWGAIESELQVLHRACSLDSLALCP